MPNHSVLSFLEKIPFFCTFICLYQKKALPLHPLFAKGACNVFSRTSQTFNYMVVLAQLVEHRIVVPSVVGSSPTFHPKAEYQQFTAK